MGILLLSNELDFSIIIGILVTLPIFDHGIRFLLMHEKMELMKTNRK